MSTVTWLKTVVVVGFVAVVVMLGYIFYRDLDNNNRCRDILGPGASWAGGNECYLPAVPVEGLR